MRCLPPALPAGLLLDNLFVVGLAVFILEVLAIIGPLPAMVRRVDRRPCSLQRRKLLAIMATMSRNTVLVTEADRSSAAQWR